MNWHRSHGRLDVGLKADRRSQPVLAAITRVVENYSRPDGDDREVEADLMTIMAYGDPARFVFMSALYGPREEPSSTELKSEEDE